MENDRLIRLTMIGPLSSGKSAALLRFVNDSYTDVYDPTLGADFKTCYCAAHAITLQVWDASGNERLREISRAYCHMAHGVVVAFDLTSRESFARAESFFGDAKVGADISLALWRCKADAGKERKVEYEEAAEKARKHNAMYVEVSAKTGTNVKDAFGTLIEEIAISRSCRPIVKQPPPIRRPESEEAMAIRRETEVLVSRLEAVEKLARIFGDEEDPITERIKTALCVPLEQDVQVDSKGDVTIL